MRIVEQSSHSANWQNKKEAFEDEEVFANWIRCAAQGNSTRIMIVGVKQKQADVDRVTDNSACLYPEGILNPDRLFLLDSEQIERLYFAGFQDGKGFAFPNKLDSMEP